MLTTKDSVYKNIDNKKEKFLSSVNKMRKSFSGHEEDDTADKTVSFRQKSRERMKSLVTLTSSEDSSDDIAQTLNIGG